MPQFFPIMSKKFKKIKNHDTSYKINVLKKARVNFHKKEISKRSFV